MNKDAGRMPEGQKKERGREEAAINHPPPNRPPARSVSSESGVNKPPQQYNASLAPSASSFYDFCGGLFIASGGPEKGEDGNGRMRPDADVGLLPEMLL